MRLRHRFQAGGTLLRTLTDELEMTGNGAESMAPGGQMDATGRIRKSEYDANASAYVPGTLWLIFDDDDGGKCIWSGRLDNEPEQDGVYVNLHANGPGKDPDDTYKNRFWQSRDEGEWTAGDAEPHNYDQDRQIEARISGRRMVFRWKRKTLFIRNRGTSRLADAETEGSSTVTVTLNAGGLAVGERVTIGEDRYTVRNTYSPGSTSIPVTPDLVRDYPANTKVYWSANDGPSEWASGLVFWKEGKDLNRAKIHIEFDRHVPASLQLLRANGPNGSLTLVKDIDLSSGALERDENAPDIAGNPDLLYLRLRRTAESDDTGTDKGFTLVVTDAVVNGLAGNADTYTADNVVRDIFNAYPGTLQVQNSDANAMPLDGTDASDGELLDSMCRLTNRFHARRRQDDGSGVLNIFQPYGETEFRLRQKAEVTKTPLPRWNVVAVPYRGPGGVKRWVNVRADPDPFPSEEFVFRLDLHDPLPDDASTAEVLGRNAVDRLSVARAHIIGRCTELINADGNVVPATRLREGDAVVLEDYNDRRVLVHYLANAPGGEPITVFSNVLAEPGPTGDPLIDRLLERRTLVLARGRSNAHATIGGFDIDRPAVPENVRVIRKEVDVRGGRHQVNAIGIFDPVVHDKDGTGTSIRSYVGQFRFRHKDTNELLRDDEDHVITEERRKRRKRDGDTSDDGDPLRMSCRIPRPHKYKPEFRAAAIDYAGEQSHWSGWAQLGEAVFTVPSVENLTVSAGLRVLEAEWDRDDPDENESDGGAMFDRRVAHFRVERYKNGTTLAHKVGRTIKVKTTSKAWRIPKGDTVNGDTWYVKVWAVDHHGFVSAVVQASAVVGETEDSQPTFTTVPDGITIDPDPHKVTVDLGSSTNIWAGDGESLHNGIDHFLIQVSTNSTFTNIVRRGRSKDPYKVFKLNGASGTYYARAYVVDKAGTKTGPTATASASVAGPSTPGSPTLNFDSDARVPGDRIRAIVTWTGVSAANGVAGYTVQAFVRNPADTAWVELPRVEVPHPVVEAGGADALSAVFRGIHRGRSFRARVRAFDKLDGTSAWSGFTTATATDSAAPPNPSNVEVFSDKSAVVVDWDPPLDPNDSEGADPDVKEYQVQIHTSTSFPAFATAPKRHKDRSVLGTKKRFNDVNLANTYHARVRSVSSSGTKGGWVTSTGAVGPARVDLATETTGQVATGQIADDAVTNAKVGAGAVGTGELQNDSVTTPILDDSGNLTGIGSWKNSVGATRVEILTSIINAIQMFQSGQSLAGGLFTSGPVITLAPPATGAQHYIALSNTGFHINAPETELGSGYGPKGRCGLQVAAAGVTAGSDFAQGVTWGGATRVASVPSSVTFTVVGTDNNVASVSAETIGSRGFTFKVQATAAAFLRCHREYVGS